jgi:hypothetical protein
MVTEAIKQAIGFFYPVADPDEALTSVVLEWVDIKISRMDERIRSYERKYGMDYSEFDKKIRAQGAVFEEEDDWIDWGDTIDLVQQLKKTRGEVLSQLLSLLQNSKINIIHPSLSCAMLLSVPPSRIVPPCPVRPFHGS